MNPMRRKPQQARGQRRVNTILDAASQVFSELGYEAATTNLIAIRANTSIGSLYQFFPNKEAILSAIATRYSVQLGGLLDKVFDSYSAPLSVQISDLIDALTDYYLATPAFQPLFHAVPASSVMRHVADSLCSPIEHRLDRALRVSNAALEPAVSQFYAAICVYILRALIPMIRQPEDEERIVEAVKHALVAYLNSTGDFDLR